MFSVLNFRPHYATATSFPGSLNLQLLLAPGGSQTRDAGNEVAITGHSGKSRDYRHVIVPEKLRFQNVFFNYTKTQRPALLIPQV